MSPAGSSFDTPVISLGVHFRSVTMVTVEAMMIKRKNQTCVCRTNTVSGCRHCSRLDSVGSMVEQCGRKESQLPRIQWIKSLERLIPFSPLWLHLQENFMIQEPRGKVGKIKKKKSVVCSLIFLENCFLALIAVTITVEFIQPFLSSK